MQKPLVSIIVPIYKVEPYLRRCIDSIVNQTYTNLEIILVDDGSPDDSPRICDEYAARDNRIIVIHQENGGLSDARNAGLKKSKGDYIYFVDSDDWLDKNAIKILYDIIKASASDIVIGNYITTNESGIFEQEKKNVQTEKKSLYSLLKYHQYGNPFFTQAVVAWNKLIKRDIAQRWPFPKGTICEDHYVTYKYYYSAKKIILTNVQTYYYRTRKGSIVSDLAKKPIQDKIIQHDYLRKRIDFFLKVDRPDIASLFTEYYTRNALYLYKKKCEGSIDSLEIRNYSSFIRSNFFIKFAVNHLKLFLIVYKAFQVILPDESLTNLLYGKKSGIEGIIWRRLHLPNTQIRKKLFKNQINRD